MGCASSKQPRCRHCKGPISPLPRSYSVPLQRQSDHDHASESHHVVALTSSTLGTFKLDSFEHNGHTGTATNSMNNCHIEKDGEDKENGEEKRKSDGFSVELCEAKTWSDMINEKIPKVMPKTPIRTPPGEPETINAWELMEGLEDYSPLRLRNIADRSFSFHAVTSSSNALLSQLNSKAEEVGTGSPESKLQENGVEDSSKPLWLEMRGSDAEQNSSPVSSGFDPEIISTFRKALEELSPVNKVQSMSSKVGGNEKKSFHVDNGTYIVSKDFAEVTKGGGDFDFEFSSPAKCPPFGEDKVVIYFTSLRGVRKTYEDCCHVRVILKGFGVEVDERDVSMHYGFREELREILGSEFRGGLPRVFVKGRYIGGAEEIRQMNEDGELEKVLKGCATAKDGTDVCELCGDVRFVPCVRCSGSCKIFIDEGDEVREGDEETGEFIRCPDCNENGIIRCPVCCH
ncbi:hypothetical protein Sjap_015771 [Stephania japonica]|uniref:Glutaredoxin domain-containing protein n=1 Tax=Stephania japonica TaxID=461633 RepID=A0AAP0IJU0_9MAGN